MFPHHPLFQREPRIGRVPQGTMAKVTDVEFLKIPEMIDDLAILDQIKAAWVQLEYAWR